MSDSPQLYNLEAEQALLGAILVNNDCLDLVSHIKPEHFIEDIHGSIYETCMNLNKAGKRANPVTLKPIFEGDERLKELGDTAYLVRLAASAATTINAPDYADSVYELAQRRFVYDICEHLAEIACNVQPNVSIVDEFTKAYSHLTESAEIKSPRIRSFDDVMQSAMKNMDYVRDNQGELIGLPTGIPKLDELTGGLKPSKLYQIPGRPGMGKSALSIFIACHASEKGHIAYFSMEMDGEENATRAIALNIAKQSMNTPDHISYFCMDKGALNPAEYMNVKKTAAEISTLNMTMIDEPNLTVSDIKRICKSIKSKYGLAGIFIDYLQLLGHENKRASKYDKATDNSRDLKRLAKELQVPIVSLTQLSRAVEARDNKRPMLSDLRDSGAIEEDADCIIFPYREEYYLQFSETKEDAARLNEVQNTIEIIVGKNRGGPKAAIKMNCNISANYFWITQ